MNNLSSYCGLVDAKIRASDKDLPVLSRSIHESLIIKILFSQIYTNLQCFSQGFLNNRFPQKVPRILFSICFTIIITWPISLDFFFLLADQSQNLILRIQIYISYAQTITDGKVLKFLKLEDVILLNCQQNFKIYVRVCSFELTLKLKNIDRFKPQVQMWT